MTLSTVATKTRMRTATPKVQAEVPDAKDADEDGRVRHRLQTRCPGAVIVEAGAAHLCLEAARHVVEVDRLRVGQADDDQAGDGEVGEVEAGAEPRFEQAGAFLVVEDADARHALDRLDDRGGLAGFCRQVGALAWADLDGDLAQDIRLPVAGGVAHQGDRAEGQAGEEAHDRHDRRQRVAGDRVLGHQLSSLAHGEARLPAIGGNLQLVGKLGVSHRP